MGLSCLEESGGENERPEGLALGRPAPRARSGFQGQATSCQTSDWLSAVTLPQAIQPRITKPRVS